RIERFVLGDVSDLSITKLEVDLHLLQGDEGIRALAARRAMGMSPETGDARPQCLRGPGHGALPTAWAHEAQLRKINGLPRHKAGTTWAQRGSAVRTELSCVLRIDHGMRPAHRFMSSPRLPCASRGSGRAITGAVEPF